MEVNERCQKEHFKTKINNINKRKKPNNDNNDYSDKTNDDLDATDFYQKNATETRIQTIRTTNRKGSCHSPNRLQVNEMAT